MIPDTMKLPYEKNTIVTEDGFHLNSWTFLPSGTDKHVSVVLAYPDAGNMSWWTSQCALLSQLGYTVVMFDYRGFGQSEPFPITREMLYYDEFVKDLTAAYRFAKEKYHNTTGIWCASMGTILTTFAAPQLHPSFIIADGFVTDPKKIQDYIDKQHKHCELPFSAAHYTATANSLKVPMLVFSGTQDKQTPDADVQAYAKAHKNVQVITFDGGHLSGFFKLSGSYMGEGYLNDMDQFISKQTALPRNRGWRKELPKPSSKN
ncbi:MAG: alpha/beta hydrolase [Bacteroidetes bacterium]|nr:alpha/beta hydrolase [Bacteroidota bacterium]